jgi:hypothetical protein
MSGASPRSCSEANSESVASATAGRLWWARAVHMCIWCTCAHGAYAHAHAREGEEKDRVFGGASTYPPTHPSIHACVHVPRTKTCGCLSTC